MKSKTNLPPRKPNLKFDSTLIESKHIPLFASWIDKKDSTHYSRNNTPYDFNLLYRSSQDGIDTKSFHRNWYNPLDWNGSYWKPTTDSFKFNFANGNDIYTAEISHVNGTAKNTIFCHPTHGPTMGKLQCAYKTWSNGNSSDGDTFYPDIGIPKGIRFKVEDYEVFQVIRK
ncbi:hypothetical protein C1645_881181 [Glomus cerebriforme]|uniref:TLDc domain-containing protein n=1 Tax=Glomus cerebriforme TaxID=658196 RepID=A0A397SBF6_9GLOM|nr:hypothetical protein C1645_881181 [Glomus cerebriforme]